MRTGILVLVLSALAFGSAGADEAVRKNIQAQYDRMSDGFLRKDARPLMQMLAPDFTNAGRGGGKQTREAFVKQFQEMFGTVRRVERSSSKIKTCQLKNGNAVVEVNTRMKMTAFDKTGMWGSKGKDVTIEGDMMDRETWARYGSRWLIRHSQTLGGKFMVNGKPMKV